MAPYNQTGVTDLQTDALALILHKMTVIDIIGLEGFVARGIGFLEILCHIAGFQVIARMVVISQLQLVNLIR